MKTNYEWLYKMVLMVSKNPDKKYYLDFSPSNCLNINKDWDWDYEYSKTDAVMDFIKWTFTHDCSKREVKKTCKKLCENICFYDEYIELAKYITKRYKNV